MEISQCENSVAGVCMGGVPVYQVSSVWTYRLDFIYPVNRLPSVGNRPIPDLGACSQASFHLKKQLLSSLQHGASQISYSPYTLRCVYPEQALKPPGPRAPGGGGGGGTPPKYLYGYVPPNGVVILGLLI